jgi:cell shape-determining protein MreC
MPKNLKTLAQLQAEIHQLKQENVHLRTLFRITLEVADQAINGKDEEEKEASHE